MNKDMLINEINDNIDTATRGLPEVAPKLQKLEKFAGKVAAANYSKFSSLVVRYNKDRSGFVIGPFAKYEKADATKIMDKYTAEGEKLSIRMAVIDYSGGVWIEVVSK